VPLAAAVDESPTPRPSRASRAAGSRSWSPSVWPSRSASTWSALGPFIDAGQAKHAGFDTAVTFAFMPFTPRDPDPLGAFAA